MKSWLLADSPSSRLQANLGQLYLLLRSFFRSPLAVIGLCIVCLLLLCAAFAPWLATQDPYQQALTQRLLPPSADHWFGTDHLGRDIWSRVIHGSRTTLLIIVMVAAIVGPLGLAIGIVAGYAGGWVDRVLMRITDIFLAFPRLVLALAFTAVLRPSVESAIIAIAVTSWPAYARLARAETLMYRSSDFIQAIELQGASPLRVLVGHITPLCLSSVIVRLTLDMAGVILIAAGLGFLGLGAPPPQAEWGAMIADGRNYLLDSWWVATIPGLAICIVSLGFNILGDGMRDVLDPKSR
ncbi:ABC transporter permease [uncultured Castellaniella sp.]|uniref:ABC transporter permease n=1 Tax=uncultured Castellaniella sp. TaxID=647907 RepID=UPI00262DDB47|nr:ABC transporter permease [uncultured Castellaniella sp.]